MVTGAHAMSLNIMILKDLLSLTIIKSRYNMAMIYNMTMLYIMAMVIQCQSIFRTDLSPEGVISSACLPMCFVERVGALCGNLNQAREIGARILSLIQETRSILSKSK